MMSASDSWPRLCGKVSASCAAIDTSSVLASYWLGIVVGVSLMYAEGMLHRARHRRFFRNGHGTLLTIGGPSGSMMADRMVDDPQFVEISPKDVA